MSQPVLTESELHLAVEKLRSEHSNTLDLYKAVAALLFFQYDSTPTTNRMYQLVRKGSMSAPAEALRLFWQELRDRSQVRMEEADIPLGLKQTAGTLFAQMWEDALQYAKQITEQNNQAIYTQLALVEQESQQLAEQLQSTTHAHEHALLQFDALTQELAQKDEQIQAQQAVSRELEKQKEALRAEKKGLENELERTAQLHKDQLQLSEQRAADMEKYARLEIDRVRQESQKIRLEEQHRLQQQHTLHQRLQDEYAALQSTYLSIQHKYQFESAQRTEDLKRITQLEQKNHDLHQLLQHLERELRSAHPSGERRAAPSRLARQRKATRSH